MIVKKHIAPDGRLVLAVCDTELLGRQIVEGNKQLDLSSSFYRGDEMQGDAVEILMKKAYMLHLVGEESIGLAAKLGLVQAKAAIAGVPFAHILCE